jgi:hypothetical protein
MTTHIMTDCETLATRPGAIVLSEAFVRFSDMAHTTLNLSVPDQEALGLVRDESTLAWWADQEAKTPGAWEAATRNPVPLVAALQHFAAWIAWAYGGGDALIWCHGAGFDAPILEALYRATGIPCPWNFWSVRDTRTLYDLASISLRDYAVPPPHVALNDAIGQTRAALRSLEILSRAHSPQEHADPYSVGMKALGR